MGRKVAALAHDMTAKSGAHRRRRPGLFVLLAQAFGRAQLIGVFSLGEVGAVEQFGERLVNGHPFLIDAGAGADGGGRHRSANSPVHAAGRRHRAGRGETEYGGGW